MNLLVKSVSILILSAVVIPTAAASEVTFTWSPNPETDLAGYRLYYSSDPNRPPYQGVEALEGPSPVEIPLSALTDINAPRFSLTALPTCVHYFFAVTAYDTNGMESDYSIEVETTLLGAPGNVAATPGLQEGILSLSWEGLAANDTGSIMEYRVHYDIDSGAPYEGTGADAGGAPITVPASELSLPLTGLTGGTTIYAAVEAVCDDGTTTLSEEVSGVVAEPACDNGVIEAGETCDPLDTCPAECDDGNSCTADTLLGNPAACTASCEHISVTDCLTGDGCCPAVCNNNNDGDCSASCDNDVIEAGETCDPPGSCPTECNDGIACTEDLLLGSAANCSAACSSNPIIDCGSDDGCCPPTCNSTNDPDCSVTCNNGVIEADETCDPPESCPSTCDDGNACTGDVLTGSAANCSAACGHSAITACASGDQCCPPGCDSTVDDDCSVSCDNEVIEAGETCDPPESCPASCDDLVSCTVDTMTGSAANCSASCSFTVITTCGPGDGCCPPGCNTDSDADCSATCGDNTLDAGETCDPRSDCPVDCNDGNVCTIGILTGSVANCSAACTYSTITECTSGDECCPPGCSASEDEDCSGSVHSDPDDPAHPGAGVNTLTGGCGVAGSGPGAAIPGVLLLLAAVLFFRRRRAL